MTAKKRRTAAEVRPRSSEKRKRPPSRPKANGRCLTPTEAADRLSVTARWLRELAKKEGLPREPGRAGRYPWPAIREWYDQYREQKIIERVQPSTFSEERAAYLRTRRKLAEIELQERQGEVVRIADVSRVWNRMLDGLRAHLLSIPATWAPELVGISNVRAASAALTELRDQLMETMSGTYQERRNGKVKRGRNTAKNLQPS